MKQMSQRKRRDHRIKRRFNAEFEVDENHKSGIAMNFSKVGLFLQTTTGAPLGRSIKIHLPLYKDHKITLSGKVVSKRSNNPLVTSVKSGIGIEIESPPPEYLQFIEKSQ